VDNWSAIDVRFPLDDQELGFHLRVNPVFAIHRQMLASFARKTMYEPARSDFLFNVLRQGDTVIDVGAHIGYFSLLASVLVGPSGIVFAFEPERRNYLQLQANAVLNRRANLQPMQQGLGASLREATMAVQIGIRDGSHVLVDHAGPPGTQETRHERLSLLTLDEVIGTTARCRVLKVNVNGGETDVLIGASQMLARQAIDFVLCTCDTRRLRRMKSSEGALRAHMAGFGYQCYRLAPEGELQAISPRLILGGVGNDVVETLVFALPDTLSRLAAER
jgi:FkbM family methyltransferase